MQCLIYSKTCFCMYVLTTYEYMCLNIIINFGVQNCWAYKVNVIVESYRKSFSQVKVTLSIDQSFRKFTEQICPISNVPDIFSIVPFFIQHCSRVLCFSPPVTSLKEGIWPKCSWEYHMFLEHAPGALKF